jgi:predicted aldo/keto reductase-like oxidoreductase
VVLPVARRHGCGILAMKVYGGRRGGFPNYRTPGPCQMEREDLEPALRYALGLEGVASAVLGVYGAREMAESIEWARRWTPLNPAEREALLRRGAERVAAWGPRFGAVG